jgi:hypothetical protein
MKNATDTYSQAKQVFDTLGVKEEIVLPIQRDNIRLFRKHLSEMIKRRQSTNRYATRVVKDDSEAGFQFVVFRIN